VTRLVRDTFVLVADDCPAAASEPPPLREGPKTLARLQYELLSERPYALTLDDLDAAVHFAKNEVPEDGREAERSALLAKGRPCMRASPLTKRYGFGAHHDSEGRIALVPVESERYRALGEEAGLSVVRAMRNKRA